MKGDCFCKLIGIIIGMNFVSLGIILYNLGEIFGLFFLIYGVLAILFDKWIYLLIGKEKWELLKNEEV